MYLQGSLQNLFDALYTSGVIQRVLKTDWKKIQTKKEGSPEGHYSLIRQINEIPVEGLLSFVKQMPIEVQDALAMEVANEYADFSDRSTIH